MHLLIIEDEPTAARRLNRQIMSLLPEATIEGPLATVEEALSWFSQHAMPDLIFMDIHLADGSSFDLLDQVPLTVPIIFTTAYDEYALQAFKAHSIDYLLKPVKQESLAAAIQKWQSLRQGNQQLEKLRQALAGDPSHLQQRFLVRLPEKLKTIEVADIAYFFIEARVTFMQLKDQRKYPSDYNLDQLESRLDPKVFFRLNRQFLVRYEAIKHIYTHSKSRFRLELSPPTQQEVVVSSERSADFKKWLTGGAEEP